MCSFVELRQRIKHRLLLMSVLSGMIKCLSKSYPPSFDYARDDTRATIFQRHESILQQKIRAMCEDVCAMQKEVTKQMVASIQAHGNAMVQKLRTVELKHSAPKPVVKVETKEGKRLKRKREASIPTKETKNKKAHKPKRAQSFEISKRSSKPTKQKPNKKRKVAPHSQKTGKEHIAEKHNVVNKPPALKTNRRRTVAKKSKRIKKKDKKPDTSQVSPVQRKRSSRK